MGEIIGYFIMGFWVPAMLIIFWLSVIFGHDAEVIRLWPVALFCTCIYAPIFYMIWLKKH